MQTLIKSISYVYIRIMVLYTRVSCIEARFFYMPSSA